MYDDDLDDSLSVLHDAVLPTAVPVLPTLDVAARFAVPGDDHGSAGAWFDVTVLTSGRVAVVVGQVPGSGAVPSVAAAAVNAVIRTSLLQHEDVATALGLADLHAHHSADARGTAMVLGIVDADDGSLTYATAGHDAPVVAGTPRPAASLPPSGGGLLGATDRPPVCRHELSTGDLVLFGSLSGPAAGAGDDTTTLAELADRERVVGDAAATCAAIAGPVEGALLHGALTLVAAELRPAPVADLDLELSLDGGTTRQARVELEEWLGRLGAPRMNTLSLVHAVTELVANTVEHARGPGRSRARLRATHTAAGDVLVDVADRGRWRDYSHDVARGRGLAMAAGLVDDLGVTSDDLGTRARLRQRLARPVLIERSGNHRARPSADSLELAHDFAGSVRMSGPLREDEVDQITYSLLLASRGGTQPLDIDLTAVTELSAGGLRLLSDLVARSSDGSMNRGEVVLHASAGSQAQSDLERAGIQHRVVPARADQT